MRQRMKQLPKTMNLRPAPLSASRQGPFETLALVLVPSIFALFFVPTLFGGKTLPAQTTNPAQEHKYAAKPALTRRAVAASTLTQSAPDTTAVSPPSSPVPIRPASQASNPARVSWSSRGLEIEASNSSLEQILRQVAAYTGAKFEGLTQDQRVFGNYGPGPASEVLSMLLDGSGYNVLIIGSRDSNAPVEIVLSARSPASLRTTTNNKNRSSLDQSKTAEQSGPEPLPGTPPDSPRSQSIQNPFSNGDPPRDPLQFMQEILDRQHQIDQRQQQEQQNIPKE